MRAESDAIGSDIVHLELNREIRCTCEPLRCSCATNNGMKEGRKKESKERKMNRLNFKMAFSMYHIRESATHPGSRGI